MSNRGTEPMTSPGSSDGPPQGATSHRRRWLIVGLLVALAVVGIVLALFDPFAAKGATTSSGVQDNTYPTSQTTVSEQSLSSQDQVSGTLGYAGSYEIINQAQGTFTSLPSVGQVIRDGQVLYRVSDSPVVLLYGATPVYRALSEGMSGPDVEQLNSEPGQAGLRDLKRARSHLRLLQFRDRLRPRAPAKGPRPHGRRFAAARPGALRTRRPAHHAGERDTGHERRPRPRRPGHLHPPPGDGRLRRRPAVRGGSRRQGDDHPARQLDDTGGSDLGRQGGQTPYKGGSTRPSQLRSLRATRSPPASSTKRRSRSRSRRPP